MSKLYFVLYQLMSFSVRSIADVTCVSVSVQDDMILDFSLNVVPFGVFDTQR